MMIGLGTSKKYHPAKICFVIITMGLCITLKAEQPLPPRSNESSQVDDPTEVAMGNNALQVQSPHSAQSEASDTRSVATSTGPDLIVGHVFGCAQLGRVGAVGSGTIGMSCWTTACTIGDEGTNWWGLPDVDHPMISVNLFRLRTLDGTDRLEQLGQSWLKHGFATENANDCGFGCTPGGHSFLNNPGCSDTYAASQFVACDMGPRSMINPYTAVMPGGGSVGPAAGCSNTMYPSRDHRDHVHNPISHRLQVQDTDLLPSLNVGAKYFAEGQYLVPHEFVAGNGTQNNNASYRRVFVTGGDECGGQFEFTEASDTITEQPAINVWEGASQTLIEPEPLVDGRGFLVYKVTDLGNVWHYEYALYNMNMDRAMGVLSIPLPAGVVISHTGFHAPLNHAPEPHTDNFTNTPWTVTTLGGAVTWSVDPLEGSSANAVRFGTMYNFWFDANTPPQSTDATVGTFKIVGSVLAPTLGPGPAGFLDCNDNSIEDRCDLDCDAPGCSVPGCGTKANCNANGVPDDCEPDCNHNGIADRCDIDSTFSQDCNADAIPDDCQPFTDCDGDSIRDDCEIYADPSQDANGNGVHDACESSTGFTIYVDDDAPNDPLPGSTSGSDPGENGSAAHPFDAIQEGIDAAASGDTVLVLDGLYNGFGNNNLNFNGKVVTLRSKNGPDQCVIDLENSNPLVVFDNGDSPATRLEGFQFVNLSISIPTPPFIVPIINIFGSSPTIAHCTFTGPGVGIACYDNSRSKVSHCTFVGLTRAIQCNASRPVVSNCLVSGGNTGILSSNGNGTTDCIGASSPRVQNTTITGAATGLSSNSGSVSIVENAIIWGNSSFQIVANSPVIASYSDVQGGFAGTGNIDLDPQFVNAGGGDYRLASGSPCIDAGDNTITSLSMIDLEGGPRLFDDPATPDTGVGTAPLVDMGADEWVDCNGNLIDDSIDIDQLTSADCNGNRVPDECEPFEDCNGNSIRDICDISSGSSQDCNENDVPDSCDISETASEDCNSNTIPDECEPDCNRNRIPDQCDITEETSTDFNGNGVPDECEIRPPGSISWNSDPLSPDRTTRSLRFTVDEPVTAIAWPGQDAIRITMIDLQKPDPPNLPQFPPPDFSAYESGPTCTDPSGCARWVGKPATFYESQGPPLSGPYRAARLQCTPFYWDWITETATGPITVVGAEIVPSSEYSVQAYSSTCKGMESECTSVSSPLSMYTRRSGDVDGEYNPPSSTNQPNAIDVAQLVNKFKNIAGAPVHARAQTQANLPELNASINALDIVAVVDGVKGHAYSFPGPCPCPSTVTCGGTCTGCPGMCVRTCVGGDKDGDPCINNAHCPNGGVCNAVGTCRDSCGRCN